jgi:hypothetical protein
VALLAGLATPATAQDSVTMSQSPQRFVFGATSSLLLHEAGHVLASLFLGARPSFGFDTGRPTVYSGIDAQAEPHKQFLFSSAGLNAQGFANELILDVPHDGGGSFERGFLAGGIATAAFYLTLGRSGSVSDIAFIASTHGMTKTQATLLYGGVALEQIVRISRSERYANFFAFPTKNGVALGYRVGN